MICHSNESRAQLSVRIGSRRRAFSEKLDECLVLLACVCLSTCDCQRSMIQLALKSKSFCKSVGA